MMNDSVVTVAIIATIQALLLAIWKVIEWRYKRYVVHKEKHRDASKFEHKAKISLELNDTLYKIGTYVNADAVMLCRFHNGGTFIEDYSIDKFTAAHFITLDPSLSTAFYRIVSAHKGVLLSLYPKTFYKLFFGGNHTVTKDSKEVDQTFLTLMKQQKFGSMYFFLIKNVTNVPVGFLVFVFKKEVSISSDQEYFILKRHNKILNLLNLKLNNYEDKD